MKSMRPLFLFLAVLLLASYVTSFSPETYLYSNENTASISYENFTVNSVQYSLVKIGSKDTFLIKGDVLLTNQSQINPILKQYYTDKFYPSDAEVQQLVDYIVSYNDSRNDGGRFRGKEEQTCSEILLLDGKVKYRGEPLYCDSDTNCDRLGQVFYTAPYTEGIRRSISYEDALKYLKGFAGATYSNDEMMSRDFSLISNLNADNINSSLAQIRSDIPVLKENKAYIESSIFRTPRQGDKADLDQCVKERCFGLCPDFSFSGSDLDSLDSAIQSTMAKSAPILNFESSSVILYSNTQDRLSFVSKEQKAEYYTALLEPIIDDVETTIFSGDSTLGSINNAALRTKVDRLKELRLAVNRSIASRDFSNMDSNVEELKQLNTNVKNSIPDIISLYNATISAKNDANAMIFILDSKDLPSEDQEKVDKLRIITNALDSSFSNGLNEAQYASFSDSYSSVVAEGNQILKTSNENPLSLINNKFRAFARRVNNVISGIFSAAALPSDLVSSNNSPLFIGGFSLLAFLSLSALVLVIFLTVFLSLKNMKKFGHITLTVLLIIALVMNLLFSAGLYFYMDKTSNNSNAEEFIIDFDKHSSVSVVVDLSDASNSASTAMSACAVHLSDSFDAMNKTTTTYFMADDACSVTMQNGQKIAKTKSECESDYSNSSVFSLQYSATNEKPKFHSVYESRAYLAGDEDFYKSCYITSLFN